MAVANTLAYSDTETLTAVMSFIERAPGNPSIFFVYSTPPIDWTSVQRNGGAQLNI
jgi:hypothetical protein